MCQTHSHEHRSIFVTVGTTKFDELIKTVTDDEVLKALNKRGYTKLIMQIGNSSVKPNCTPRCGFTHIEAFNLKPSIQEFMRSADLIVSHAGAGSCLEALEVKKPLIVVINPFLMDNHQLELAEQLFKDNHLYQCTCDTFLTLIKNMNLSQLQPFTDDKSIKIGKIIDKIMGFA